MNQFNNVIFLTGSDLTVNKDKDGVNITGGDSVGEAAVENTTNTEQETTTSTGTPTQQTIPQEGGGLFGSSIWTMALIYVAVIGALYFFSIKPQRKREKLAKEMRSSLQVGDNIVTSTGFYGKIVDIGGDVFVVEFGTNKGIKIPVNKNDVVAKKEPDFTLNS